MKRARPPRLHVLVCVNRREGSPLGPGCAERGDAVYDALKAEVATRGAIADIWVTRTHCLGICPKRGATAACYPSEDPIRSDVEVSDVAALLELPREGADASPSDDGFRRIALELDALEALQTKKVLDLARRLRPGLTLEDVMNPHDFPELNDADFHYADGVLTGIKSVSIALRAMKQRERGTLNFGSEDEP